MVVVVVVGGGGGGGGGGDGGGAHTAAGTLAGESGECRGRYGVALLVIGGGLCAV